MKRNTILAIIGGVVLIGGGIVAYQMTRPGNDKSKNSQANSGVITVDFSEPICDQVALETIENAIGKDVSSAKPTTGNITNVCKYYLNDTDYIALRLNKLSYETQKSGTEKSGATISTDDSINADHFIVTAPTGQMANISIKITDTLILTVERSSEKAVSDDKFIALAASVVKRLQSDDSESDNDDSSSSGSDNTDSTVSKLEGEEFITNFFKLIDDGKASEAVMIMTLKNTDDDSTKQAWGVQFNSMKSVSTSNVEAYDESSWTDVWREYKVTLEITMDPDSANVPIPYYGYDNGKNIRFVILAKEDGAWKVDGISTGP